MMRLLRLNRWLVLVALISVLTVFAEPERGAASGVGLEVVDAATGFAHTCGVTVDGTLKCWGYNYNGELGDGTTDNRSQPTDVVGFGGGAAAVAAGIGHTCALTTEGGVACWGLNDHGQVGDGTLANRHAPVDVTGLSSGVASLDAGLYQTCAVTIGGGVKCWGENYGNTPVDIPGLSSGAADVAVGFRHACAVTTPGTLKCWGENEDGRLGDGTTTDQTAPVAVVGLSGGVSAVSAGGGHTCAVTTGGALSCWGDNTRGQLGNGGTTDRSHPGAVCGDSGCGSPLYDVVAVEAGSIHTCAILSGGDVQCWGYNEYGQLGDGTTTHRTAPVDVGPLNAVDLSAGLGHTCAASATGVLWCWGSNREWLLGDGTTIDRHEPVAVLGLGPKQPGSPGDVNCDGTVDAVDAALVLQLDAGFAQSLPCQTMADVNADGSIDSIDAALILQYVAGLIPGLPPL